jgi:hypothetical protein
MPRTDRKEVEVTMHLCALCNERIDDIQIEFDEFVELDGEYWHVECYAEYFDEVLETV